MSFNVYVRSAHAKCLPATVRPSDVNLYFQLDNWHDQGELLQQSEIAKCNVANPLDITALSAVRVVNCFKSINDVVVVKTNNENESDVPCMEDGRSRRYLLGLGSFYQIISLPINESYLPIIFANRSTKEGLTTGVTMQLRFLLNGEKTLELLVIFIGGKNLQDDKIHSIEDYKQDIACYVETIQDIRRSASMWKKAPSDHDREFVILHYKDHSSPAESFDYALFHQAYGKLLGLVKYEEKDQSRGIATNDIVGGFTSSKKFHVSIALHGYDDHYPALFTVHTQCTIPTLDKSYRLATGYRLKRGSNIYGTVRSHGKQSRLSDIEYKQIRNSHPITYR